MIIMANVNVNVQMNIQDNFVSLIINVLKVKMIRNAKMVANLLGSSEVATVNALIIEVEITVNKLLNVKLEKMGKLVKMEEMQKVSWAIVNVIVLLAIQDRLVNKL